jgi:hypothetical protein
MTSAALPGHVCRFAALGHSELPRSREVALTVVDLLESGSTARLEAAPGRPTASTQPAQVSDSALRTLFTGKLDWHAMSADERRAWFDSLNSPLVVP